MSQLDSREPGAREADLSGEGRSTGGRDCTPEETQPGGQRSPRWYVHILALFLGSAQLSIRIFDESLKLRPQYATRLRRSLGYKIFYWCLIQALFHVFFTWCTNLQNEFILLKLIPHFTLLICLSVNLYIYCLQLPAIKEESAVYPGTK